MKGIKMKNKTKFIALSAMLAAAYVVLTLISSLFGLSSGAIQVRISEMLCVLAAFTPAAVPGITIGCLLANIICGGTIYDIIFGTLATLIGLIFTRVIKNHVYLSSIPTIVSNMIIIPAVLVLSGVGGWDLFPYFVLTVGAGEIISCGILGTVLAVYIKKHRNVSMLFDTQSTTSAE